jgi:hypothetical protein
MRDPSALFRAANIGTELVREWQGATVWLCAATALTRLRIATGFTLLLAADIAGVVTTELAVLAPASATPLTFLLSLFLLSEGIVAGYRKWCQDRGKTATKHAHDVPSGRRSAQSSGEIIEPPAVHRLLTPILSLASLPVHLSIIRLIANWRVECTMRVYSGATR